MPGSDFHTSKLSLAYAKIVANPTATGWSQVYNAGSLFIILSLTLNYDSAETKDPLPPATASLPVIGKDIFNNLEAEFFSLEEKNHRNIKAAIEKSLEKISPGIETDACVAYFKDDILYLYILGKGKIIMKRGDKLGLLLEKKDTRHLLSASGHLLQGDTILLQTDHFTRNVAEKNITDAFELQLPNDIADSLSPHVHEKEDGSQVAIIITYNGAVKAYNPPEENTQPINKPITPSPAKKPIFPSLVKQLKKIKLPLHPLSKKQIITLGLGLVLLVILIASIIYTKTQQENIKFKALYNQIYQQAQKNYDEGKSIAKLNQNLAQNDFIKARQILKENIGKFKTNSEEQIKLQSLLNQIEAERAPTENQVAKISPVAANVSEFDLLNIEKNNHALAYSQDNASNYLLTDKSVTTIDKNNGAKKDVLLNNKDWTQPVALSTYQGNIYILDQKAGILKFVASQNGFSKIDYFKGTPPDLEKAQGIAIDGSIWILLSDGQVLKYTKGEKENFAITGLDKPLKNPTEIFSNRDMDSLYILDNGNGRILKLEKNGQYQNQYNSDLLRDAQDFEVLEKEQKILILSEGKIWEIKM